MFFNTFFKKIHEIIILKWPHLVEWVFLKQGVPNVSVWILKLWLESFIFKPSLKLWTLMKVMKFLFKVMSFTTMSKFHLFRTPKSVISFFTSKVHLFLTSNSIMSFFYQQVSSTPNPEICNIFFTSKVQSYGDSKPSHPHLFKATWMMTFFLWKNFFATFCFVFVFLWFFSLQKVSNQFLPPDTFLKHCKNKTAKTTNLFHPKTCFEQNLFNRSNEIFCSKITHRHFPRVKD